ncbi:MAG: sltH [Gammaproteobacteria bacterium]|nr:MAG: sltH [Gammaproteobacteria bacterium]TND06640.1 MAG: sltH [Gammaproteobacteria bacterium]
MRIAAANVTFCLLLFAHAPAFSDPGKDLASRRADFLAAEQALAQRDNPGFRKRLARLVDYPLYPYLIYAELRPRLATATDKELSDFLTRYADTPLAPRLRYSWLLRLAQQGAWQQFLNAYQAGDDATLQCYQRRALLRTGRKTEAFARIEQLWLVAFSLPDACDPLFQVWQESGAITTELLWRRIQLAMQVRELQVARHLAGSLPANQQRWAKQWREVDANPKLLTHGGVISAENRFAGEIVVHGVKRYARLYPDEVLDAWEKIRRQYTLTDEQRDSAESQIALYIAVAGRPEGLSWLAVVPPEKADRDIREWRIRSALGARNWDAVLAWIDRLPQEEQQSPRWRYWTARSLAELGQQEIADEIFLDLAQLRHYYGFLAADRLETPYQFQEQPLDYPRDGLVAIENIPGIRRARELLLLERIVDARREWYHATRGLDDDQRQRAAKLAQQWGWHDRAIFAVAGTKHDDDLELRFPLAFRAQVLEQAERRKVDPALAFAIIRQESAFTEDVRSPAGALGLMQLMPETARRLAKTVDIRLTSTAQLLHADTNINLGIAYLRKLLDRFGGHPVLATAAYNAGDQRVRRWLPVAGPVPVDLWVETIPFYETRGYLQNVFAYAPIYERRLGQTHIPLRTRMPPITKQPD